MAISQTRWRSAACKANRFEALYPNCTFGASSANYGVNPVFLPKSVLYNEGFAHNDTSYYANFSLGFDNATLRSSQGIPFGFQPFGSKPTFHYILDINFNNEQAQESLQYMQDGYFIDNATKEVSVQLITYNGIVHKFTLFEVLLTFQTGGKIPATYNIQSINVDPYRTSRDWCRFALELLFVACVCWNLYEEVKEMYQGKKLRGSYLSHFADLWNIVDAVSLAIMIACIVLWINFVLNNARTFEVNLRYNIYDLQSWVSGGQYWDIVPPGSGFSEALGVFRDVERMVYFRTYYVALQGINVLLMVLRILKLMDFQPRMGTITRTVAAAAPDLVHFFILFFVVFFGFAMYGHLVFGRAIDKFRTLPVSLVTCFSAMLGNDSTNDFLMQLQGWELVAAVLFWWSYIFIMVFIIFNLLIAIVVEAFIAVRKDMEDVPSMPSEILWISRHIGRRVFTPLRTDQVLLRQLRVLGAGKANNFLGSRSMASIDSCGFGSSSRRSSLEDLGSSPSSVEQVIKIDNREMDERKLEAMFDRMVRRKEGSKHKLKEGVNAKILADVVFHKFKQNAKADEDHGSEGLDHITTMENMKDDLAAVKEMMKTLVGTVSSLQTQQAKMMEAIASLHPSTEAKI